MEKERRRTPRISSRIRVEFVEKNRQQSQTINVSRNGVFIKGSSSREMNSLVRLKLYLPPDEKSIEIFGRVAWQGTVDSHQGIGVHFLELASGDRDQWLGYISQVEALAAPAEPPATSGTADTAPAGSERRKAVRTSASFMVRFKTSERLDEFVAKNLSMGGMFLATPVLKTLGERVTVVLIHPVTDRDFEIEAEVVRLNETPNDTERKGMGLQFVEMSDEKKKELDAFLKTSG